jgi:hypothetical protein
MKRHWSFVVFQKKYLYSLALLWLTAGVVAAVVFKTPTHVNRAGNFIMGVGVWATMRYTLREGISRYKDLARSSPLVPGTNAVNSDFFNDLTFALGDAHLQLHGFALVLAGSVVGSLGDLLLKAIAPALFR